MEYFFCFNEINVYSFLLAFKETPLLTFSTVFTKQEYVLWNAVSVPLLHFARYCSIVQTLSLKYPVRDLDLEVTGCPWSPDRTIRYVQFPIRALSELTEI